MRLHGRNGLVYLSVRNGDPASPLTYLNSWAISWAPDVSDVTTITDTQHVYVEELPEVSGTFTGFLDDATSQTYLAAVDGLPRSMFLYPDSTNMSRYFSGPVLADLAVSGNAAAAVSIAVNWVAAGLVTRTGPAGIYTATYTATY
ncbi:MAG TPA: hypothetical protein VGL33_21045 [Streptosporangiaceae bacterium]